LKSVPSFFQNIDRVGTKLRIAFALSIPRGLQQSHRQVCDTTTVDRPTAAMEASGLTLRDDIAANAVKLLLDSLARYVAERLIEPLSKMSLGNDFIGPLRALA